MALDYYTETGRLTLPSLIPKKAQALITKRTNRAVARDVTNHVTNGTGVQLAAMYNASVCSFCLFQEVWPQRRCFILHNSEDHQQKRRRNEEVDWKAKKRVSGSYSVYKQGWFKAKILKHDRICSRHFLSGMSASIEDEANPDWLPSMNLGPENVPHEE